MPNPQYTLTNESITIILEGKPYTVKQGDPNFPGARKAILTEDWAALLPMFSKGLAIEKWAKGAFKFSDGFMYYQNEKLPEELNQRMLNMANNGDDPSYLMRFWARLMKNTSWRSVHQLYGFIVHDNIAIDADGFIMAYKSVRMVYLDHHTGKIDNHPGVTNEMPRNKISDDPTLPCHFGFHVGSLKYAQETWKTDARVLIVKVDPADVVCVPNDCSQQKVRVCKYEVLGHYGSPLPSTTFVEEDPEIDEDEEIEDDYTSEDLEGFECVKSEHSWSDIWCEDEETEETKARAEKASEPEMLRKEIELAKQFGPIVLKAETDPSKFDNDWSSYDNSSLEELAACSIEMLRKYARHGLNIIGASKIPGGKTTLLERIKEVRGK